jgi:ubiquitin-like 1-activating enzyme E1 B
VPAIATTNAVIAGLIVLEALKVVDARRQDVRCTYLMQANVGRKFMCMRPESANPAYVCVLCFVFVFVCGLMFFCHRCYVCQQATLTLAIDTKTSTLGTLVARVLRDAVGFNQVCCHCCLFVCLFCNFVCVNCIAASDAWRCIVVRKRRW